MSLIAILNKPPVSCLHSALAQETERRDTLLLTIETYSSSVGQCKCSLQYSSIPCPRCKSSNSSMLRQRDIDRDARETETIDSTDSLRRDNVKHMLVSEEVGIVG